jgi:hypothetical protein
MATKKAHVSAKPAPSTSHVVAPEAKPVLPPSTVIQTPVAEKPIDPVLANSLPHNKVIVGAWAYIIGLIIAFGAAVFLDGTDYRTYAILGILGITVGLLNITDEEVLMFLVASITLVVCANSVRLILFDVVFLNTFLTNAIIFTSASAFIVSIKSLFKVAKSE